MHLFYKFGVCNNLASNAFSACTNLFVSLVPKVRKLHEIVEVLHRYAAWNISTSKVEQNFALRAWIINKQRNVDPYREQDLLTIADHNYASEVSTVFEKAITIWRQLYLPPRARHVRPTRAPKSYKRTIKHGTLKGWIDHRRKQVGILEASVVRASLDDVEAQAADLSAPA